MTRKKPNALPTASLVRSSAAEYLTFVAASGKGGVEVPTINYHLKKVFEDSELEQDSVIRNFRITAADTAGEDFDGVLPWGLVENRPFLRCLHGLSRALLCRDRREDAAAALRRLLRLDPADHLCARASVAAIEAGKTWREMETAP